MALPLGLAAAAYLLALLQRPGFASSDTKIDLHVDPGGFLADVASVWSPTGSLGHVQGGQYSGYLWPMAPFFALGDLIGLSPWLVQRLWLGTLLALAAWGTVRLVDALLESRSRRRAPRGGRADDPQPVRRGVHEPDEHHAARLRGAAVAAARGAPRRAPSAQLVVARGVRSDRGVVGRRRERRGDRVAAARSRAAARVRGGGGGRAVARRPRAGVAHGARHGRGVGLVGRAGGGARRLRHRLPQVHRAGRLDLGHHEPAARACG